MRLAIGGPTRDDVPIKFAVHLAAMYAYTLERGPWGRDVIPPDFCPGTYQHVGREWVLEQAIKRGATHLLWLDTDMTFQREVAVLLSMHNQPIVGSNYRVRQPSGLFTAQRDGQRIDTHADSYGLEAVDAMGFGVVLMRTDLVQDMPRPWFRHGINNEGGDIGEDIMFCRALRAAGQTIYIDHDISKSVSHVGQCDYQTIQKPQTYVYVASSLR